MIPKKTPVILFVMGTNWLLVTKKNNFFFINFSGQDHPTPSSSGEGDDAPLLTSENSDLRSDVISTDQNSPNQNSSNQDSSRSPCVFAFDLAIFSSLSLILLEALCYFSELQKYLELSFYIVRLVYYCLLLSSTVAGAILLNLNLPFQVSTVHSFSKSELHNLQTLNFYYLSLYIVRRLIRKCLPPTML